MQNNSAVRGGKAAGLRVERELRSDSFSIWAFSFAAMSLYAAVYWWDYVELRVARFSLIALLCAVVACALGIWRSQELRFAKSNIVPSRNLFWSLIGTAVALHIVIALWIVRHAPGNVIDVFTFQTDAVSALFHGVNPYGITHANAYSPSEIARFYPPGVVVASRLHLGFPYPPLAFLAAIPGYLLGDIRYSHITAVAISAVLIAALRRSWAVVAVICVVLFNPLTFLVERFSWTESFVALALTSTVYASVKRRWWLPIALGMLFGSKQYAVLALPFVLLLADYDWRRSVKLVLQALGVAAAVTVPFALWDVRAFVHDTVTFFVQYPRRTDALSFAARIPVPLWVVMALVAVATAWSIKVSKRHPAMFAACFGFAFLFFVCVNKQAFGNYYFLAAHSFWLTVVAVGAIIQKHSRIASVS